jgi:hypothetical protein
VTDPLAPLPPDPQNLVQAWAACDDLRLELWLTDEPLDRPRDRWLAEWVIEHRAVTRVTGPDDLKVDLTLVMKGYDFDTAWNERRTFRTDADTQCVAATACDAAIPTFRGAVSRRNNDTTMPRTTPDIANHRMFWMP